MQSIKYIYKVGHGPSSSHTMGPSKAAEVMMDRYPNANNFKVILYGSRAKGTYKPFSDIDITLLGDKLEHDDLLDIIDGIEDLLLPYMFDISLFSSLKNENLIDHINRVGVEVYSL